jgi:hypothetical protein
VFLPEPRPEGDAWRLLLLNSHGSHITVDFLYDCIPTTVANLPKSYLLIAGHAVEKMLLSALFMNPQLRTQNL